MDARVPVVKGCGPGFARHFVGPRVFARRLIEVAVDDERERTSFDHSASLDRYVALRIKVSCFTTESTEATESDRKGKGWSCPVRTPSSFPTSVFSVLSVVKSYPAPHWIAP